MKNSKTKICYLVLISTLLMTLLIIGCEQQAPTTSGQGKYGGTLKIISRTAPVSLGATTEVEIASQYLTVMHTIYDHLVRNDLEGNPTPDLTTSVSISPDGKTYLFNLRKGVKFHDGTDFNAAAVKYHMDKMKYGRATLWKNVESTTVVDDYTVKVVLQKIDVTFCYLLSRIYGEIGSPTAAEKSTTDATRALDHLVGTGPFKFVDWQRDVYVKMAKFVDYWQKGKPYLDAIEWKFISDPTTALMSFQAGEGQILWRSLPKDAADLKKQGYKVLSSDSGLLYLIPDAVNADSPFANIKVRQAVEYAIDRKAITNVVGFGFQKPLAQICPPNIITGYVNNLAARDYNPEKAKQLLKEAGYPNGFQTTLTSTSIRDKDPVVAMQGYLKAVGIDAKVDILDDAKYRSLCLTGWKNGLVFRDTGIDADFVVTMSRYFDINSVYMKSMLRPAGYQDGLNQALAEPDNKKRKEITQKLTKQLFDEAVAIPLWTDQMVHVLNKSVNDTHMCEIDMFIWNPADTWISK